MSNDELLNRLIYGGVWLLKILLTLVVAGIYAHTMPGFRPGEPFVEAATEIATVIAFLGTGLTTWLDANRPRDGSAGLSKQVNELREQGVSRQDMAVVTADDAELLKTEAARLRRIKPLRDAADAGEALEAASHG